MKKVETWDQNALIDVRRHLHQHPELSGCERETAHFIAEQLTAMGLHADVGAHGAPNGVVATVVGEAGDGPVLGWRADTDALPILEANDVPYASQNAGVMHACGHDVHTTIGLGIAAQIAARRDVLRGAVKFIFQPEEEGVPGSGIVGAEAMARGGVLENPSIDALFALHCMPSLEVGTIGFRHRAMWAGSDAWTLTLHGQQSHAAYPQDGVDPIYVAGHIIVALQSIAGRVVDSRRSCVVSVGKIHAGEAFNIIPETVTLVGLVRTLDEDVRQKALAALRSRVEGICAGFGVRAELEISRGAHVTANDPDVVRNALKVLGKSAGEEALLEVDPQMGAEDFASFSMRRPSAYFLLGVGNPERGIVHPIHSPRFDVDESCLGFAVEHFSQLLMEYGAAAR